MYSTPTIAPTPTRRVLEDINGDKVADVLGFGVFGQFLLGMTSIDEEIADLDGNGSANAIDFALFRMYLLGKISKFPAS